MAGVDRGLAVTRVMRALAAMDPADPDWEFDELERIILETGDDPDTLGSLGALVQTAVGLAGLAIYRLADAFDVDARDLLDGPDGFEAALRTLLGAPGV